jgi:pentatricopeptide repeat protein
MYFDEIDRHGLQPNLSTFVVLIETFRAKKDVKKILEMFDIMREYNVEPSSLVYFHTDKALDQVVSLNIIVMISNIFSLL